MESHASAEPAATWALAPSPLATGFRPLAMAASDALDAACSARARIRAGLLSGHTAGLAPGLVQANLVVLPAGLAEAFRDYCRLNPGACPLLAQTAPGDPHPVALGRDIDVRTDLPMYRIWRAGRLAEERTDVRELWRPDLVSFILGCSFSFEEQLLRAGIPLRHLRAGRNVAMYRTGVATRPAGPFRGPLVVSMRPVPRTDVERAAAISARLPHAHGAPVHIGDPAVLGIGDLARPDYGDPETVGPAEVAVFWACGVTSQAAIEAARPDFSITHKPGHMLITDLANELCAMSARS